ncbi:MAG: glycosyltransferase family 1 protein [Lachnospiraceae bacterium]
MSEPIRVLQVLGGTTLCGAESRIMDIYRNIDRTVVQFDFMVHNQREDYYNEEIRQLGGHIYRVPRFRVINLYHYTKAWKRFFAQHKEYRAVHGHMTSTASFYLPIAKRSGVPVTIAHARSAGTDPGFKGKLTRCLRHALARKADYCLACSKEAGYAVFGKRAMQQGQVQMIPNAIALEGYRFHEPTRKRLRQQYGLEGHFVIGHVGRFHYAKNHTFLIEIFSEIVKKQDNAVLLLLGEGELMEQVREQAEAYGVLDRVIFAGSHGNISEYYQAMDYFVFPSHFEGLPGTVVEAQAAGLPCLLSDTITKEVCVTGLVTTMSLQTPAVAWAEEVVQHQDYHRGTDLSLLQQQGFDVLVQAKRWESFYSGKNRQVL